VAKLEIRLLGTPQFLRDNSPITNFISNKVPALLAYLAVERRPHSRDKLATLFWGEMSDADARNNLRQALTNLRKFVASELAITRDAIELTGDIFLDSAQFTSSLKTASFLNPHSALVVLTDSLSLYQGDFLEGFHIRDAHDFEDWMLTERARLRELAMQTLHTLTQFHASRGHFMEAMSLASRLLTFDPWREEAHRQLMLLQARTGQFSSALSQYEICKKILEKELGIGPSLETTELYERIRSARHSARHNLPASSSEFIGRTKELEELHEKLANPACRLITLTGLGGVGKTRLAQETARQCTDMFINGAWLVPLAAVEADGFISAIANAMDFTFGAGDHKKQIINYLRKKELLLVLDNFEHLLDSSVLVADVLKYAPEVKILVTSRERLDVDGEWVVELSGLAVSSMEANQLFIQCAKRARAEIQIGEKESISVSDICGLVGGLPLGIEIAAAWTRSMDLADIKSEIQTNLDFLGSTRRDVPERQRSLRAVFESTWAKLSESEQKTFAALSVFRGGFTSEAGEHLAGNFSPLIEKSLVQRNGSRFELHEVLRQFADEKLHAKETVWGAHAAYFSQWSQRCAAMLEHESFPLMTVELENIRMAWVWSVEQKKIHALTELAPFIKRYLDVQGRYHEGMELFGLALTKLRAPKSADGLPLDPQGHLTARLLMYNALWVADAGKPDESLQTLLACLAYFRRANDEQELMVCLNGLGNANRFLGREDTAAVYYREELEIARRTNSREEEGTALNNLALTINTLGDFQEAERLHRDGLALRRELDDYPGLSSTLINLGVALFDQRRYAEAKLLLYEAIEIARQYNHSRNLAAALGNLGGILVLEKQYDEALKLYMQGLEIHRNTGYRFGIAIALDNVGTVQYHLGQNQEALYYLKQSIREARDIRSELIILDALVSMAGVYARSGDKERALELAGLIRQHPKSDPETLQTIFALMPDFTAGLPVETVRAAEERGRNRSLGEIVEETLQTG
jgi:DNA-binding SARP family transcriptional activator/predicted ATPase/Tfp pilus assembly protein PilF